MAQAIAGALLLDPGAFAVKKFSNKKMLLEGWISQQQKHQFRNIW